MGLPNFGNFGPLSSAIGFVLDPGVEIIPTLYICGQVASLIFAVSQRCDKSGVGAARQFLNLSASDSAARNRILNEI